MIKMTYYIVTSSSFFSIQFATTLNYKLINNNNKDYNDALPSKN